MDQFSSVDPGDGCFLKNSSSTSWSLPIGVSSGTSTPTTETAPCFESPCGSGGSMTLIPDFAKWSRNDDNNSLCTLKLGSDSCVVGRSIIFSGCMTFLNLAFDRAGYGLSASLTTRNCRWCLTAWRSGLGFDVNRLGQSGKLLVCVFFFF